MRSLYILGTAANILELTVSDKFNINQNNQLTEQFGSSYPSYDKPQSSGLK